MKTELHNNGYATSWHVEKNNDDASFPKINQYLIDQGISLGESVLVHNE